jgi:hypothetical protein
VAVIAAVAVILVEVVTSPRRLVGPEWVAGTGAVGTGAVGTGAVGTGAVGTGAVGTGVAGTGAVGTGVAGTGAVGTGVAGTGAVGTGAVGTGVAGTGAVAVATGAVAIGIVATGAVAIGMVAIGKTGTTIGAIMITTTMMSSLSVASAFHRGGAGDGDTRMDITATGTLTAMGIRTAMATGAMDTVTTVTVMVMDIATVAGTALPLGREWLNYSADLPAPAIIGAQSMVSWGLRLGGQFELTSRTTVRQADSVPSGDDAFSEP